MDAQCWLWGQDIRFPDGNLLVGYGMRRCDWEDSEHGTHYRRDDGDLSVVLWSGGMLLAGMDSSVVIARHGLFPRLLPGLGSTDASLDPRNEARQASSIPLGLDDPRATEVFRWIRDYEAWVVGKVGEGWRALCALRWLEAEEVARRLSAEVGVEYEPLPPLPANGLSSCWDALARVEHAPIIEHLGRPASRRRSPV